MKSVRMMAWLCSLFMLAACDFTDPHTLNVNVMKNEAGPTSSLQQSGGGENKKDGQIYDFTLFDIDALPVSLSKFRGKVLLLVNTASRWRVYSTIRTTPTTLRTLSIKRA